MASPRWILVALGATSGLLVALLFMGPPASEGPPSPTTGGFFLQEPLPAPTLALQDQRGRHVTLEDFRGRAVAVFFGYTHCPDVCPLTLAHLSRALGELDPGARRLQVLFVSVDPERDTPDRLARYLESFHPSLLGLTGEPHRIEAQARGFGVPVIIPEHEPGETYLVDHGARTFLLDGHGRVVGTLPATATYADIRQGLETLLRAVSASGA